MKEFDRQLAENALSEDESPESVRSDDKDESDRLTYEIDIFDYEKNERKNQ